MMMIAIRDVVMFVVERYIHLLLTMFQDTIQDDVQAFP